MTNKNERSKINNIEIFNFTPLFHVNKFKNENTYDFEYKVTDLKIVNPNDYEKYMFLQKFNHEDGLYKMLTCNNFCPFYIINIIKRFKIPIHLIIMALNEGYYYSPLANKKIKEILILKYLIRNSTKQFEHHIIDLTINKQPQLVKFLLKTIKNVKFTSIQYKKFYHIVNNYSGIGYNSDRSKFNILNKVFLRTNRFKYLIVKDNINDFLKDNVTKGAVFHLFKQGFNFKLLSYEVYSHVSELLNMKKWNYCNFDRLRQFSYKYGFNYDGDKLIILEPINTNNGDKQECIISKSIIEINDLYMKCINDHYYLVNSLYDYENINKKKMLKCCYCKCEMSNLIYKNNNN